jgi:aspartyl/asparaginyl-tRNA synthetase
MSQAIFRMQSGVCQLFRGFLRSQGFTEIHTPKLVGTASEGGADVFKVEYFGGAAYLAQSPQLYKQMALMADLERVFEVILFVSPLVFSRCDTPTQAFACVHHTTAQVGPVFRAEHSMTHRHMTEFTGLDMEMTFKEHYSEVLDVLDRTFNAVFDGLNQEYSEELDIVRAQHPFTDLRYRYPCLRLAYPEAMELLRSKGPALLRAMQSATTDDAEREHLQQRERDVASHGDLDDIGTEDEKLLGEIVGQVHGQDFYIIDKFPAHIRPFYTMPDPSNAELSNSYDIFIRGEEVCFPTLLQAVTSLAMLIFF